MVSASCLEDEGREGWMYYLTGDEKGDNISFVAEEAKQYCDIGGVAVEFVNRAFLHSELRPEDPELHKKLKLKFCPASSNEEVIITLKNYATKALCEYEDFVMGTYRMLFHPTDPKILTLKCNDIGDFDDILSGIEAGPLYRP